MEQSVTMLFIFGLRFVSFFCSLSVLSFTFFFFFFQAEDGIRDHCVTGVQTCALPIWINFHDCRFARWHLPAVERPEMDPISRVHAEKTQPRNASMGRFGHRPRHVEMRSEERRVGKECRSRWWADH